MDAEDCVICGRNAGPCLVDPKNDTSTTFWLCDKHTQAYTSVRESLGTARALAFVVGELRDRAEHLNKLAGAVALQIPYLPAEPHV